MRHRKLTIKLGRAGAHRDSMLANLVCDLIEQRRIRTTLPKARAARRLAERMVTLGKKGDLASRRLAIARLKQVDRVGSLFSEIAPGFENRNGGYTRILKLGKRMSDNAEMALLEWVEGPAPKKAPETTATAEKKAKSSAKKADAEKKDD